MGNVVNLNRARKARARASDQAQAVANRAAFGRTGEQKARDDADRTRAEMRLDGAKRE